MHINPIHHHLNIFFFWIRENLTYQKVYFMDLGEQVKSRLSQILTKNARLNSNSRPIIQISNALLS